MPSEPSARSWPSRIPCRIHDPGALLWLLWLGDVGVPRAAAPCAAFRSTGQQPDTSLLPKVCAYVLRSALVVSAAAIAVGALDPLRTRADPRGTRVCLANLSLNPGGLSEPLPVFSRTFARTSLFVFLAGQPLQISAFPEVGARFSRVAQQTRSLSPSRNFHPSQPLFHPGVRQVELPAQILPPLGRPQARHGPLAREIRRQGAQQCSS